MKEAWELTRDEWIQAGYPADNWSSVIARNIGYGKPVPDNVRRELEAYQAEKARPKEEKRKAEIGDKIVRYTHKDGTGLLNNAGLDRSKLTDDEEEELIGLMDLGLQQPPEGTTGEFWFTEEGDKQHARMIELLRKASRSGVKRRTSKLASEPTWQSEDGQVAIEKKKRKIADLPKTSGDLSSGSPMLARLSALEKRVKGLRDLPEPRTAAIQGSDQRAASPPAQLPAKQTTAPRLPQGNSERLESVRDLPAVPTPSAPSQPSSTPLQDDSPTARAMRGLPALFRPLEPAPGTVVPAPAEESAASLGTRPIQDLPGAIQTPVPAPAPAAVSPATTPPVPAPTAVSPNPTAAPAIPAAPAASLGTRPIQDLPGAIQTPVPAPAAVSPTTTTPPVPAPTAALETVRAAQAIRSLPPAPGRREAGRAGGAGLHGATGIPGVTGAVGASSLGMGSVGESGASGLPGLPGSPGATALSKAFSWQATSEQREGSEQLIAAIKELTQALKDDREPGIQPDGSFIPAGPGAVPKTEEKDKGMFMGPWMPGFLRGLRS